MRPVVHTVRGPQAAGKRSSISTQNLASARPASLRMAIRVVPAWFCSPVKMMRYCQIPTMDVTTPMSEAAAFERLALFDMGFEISDMPPAFAPRTGAAGEISLAQRVTHALAAVAVGCRVDIGFGDAADIGAAAEEVSEMPFLVAPGRNFDRAVYVRIGIDDAGGLERIDHAERSIEPARVVLAFQMRSRQQLRSGLRAGAEDVADAVDLAREAGLGKPLHQPLQRA